MGYIRLPPSDERLSTSACRTSFAFGVRAHLEAHDLFTHVHHVPFNPQFVVGIAGLEPAEKLRGN